MLILNKKSDLALELKKFIPKKKNLIEWTDYLTEMLFMQSAL